MAGFETRTVTDLVSQRPGLQRVLVDGQPAYVLTDLIGPVAAGDRVVVNTTAVDLGLGTGGSHVVHWNLSRDAWPASGSGRLMKLRYTSLQVNVAAGEEDPGFGPAPDLGAMPVVACDLHSQMAAAAVAFSRAAPDRRLVYVMTDSAALPLALSDVAAELRGSGILAATVSCGQAFGGDYEAVSIASALQVATTLAGADAVVVAPGPGVAGTAAEYGFGGVEVATVVDVASHLGARPIVAVRWSDTDRRDRHRGLSHHTATALAMCQTHPLIAVPRVGGVAGEALAVLAGHGEMCEADVSPEAEAGIAALGLTTMGRNFGADPGFFRFAAAAGAAAAQLLEAPR